MTWSPTVRRRNAIVAVLAAGLVLPFTALTPRPAAAAGIALVHQGTEQTSGTGNVTVTTSVTTTAGNLLVAALANSGQTFSGPAGWMNATGVTQIGNGRVEIWYYPNNPGGITSAAFTSAGTSAQGQLSEWSGTQLSSVLDQTGTATATTTSSVTVSSTSSTVVTGELAVTAFTASSAETSYTAGVGWNHLFTDTANAAVSDYKLALPVATASEIETASPTNQNWAAVLATFEPLQTPPGAVGSLAAVAGSNQATVSWTAPSTGGSVSYYVLIALVAGTTARNTTAVASGTTSKIMTGLAGGTAYKFQVYAVGPGGTGTSATTASTVTPTGVHVPYATAVLNDSPTLYYRLDETAGTTALDSSGNGSTATEVNSPAQGSGGALATDTDGAVTMNGSSQYLYGNTSYVNPTTYSVEAWFKTSTVIGGVIAGFHNPQVGTALGGQSDRLIYMNNAGQLYFGVYNTGIHTIHSTAAFNNGAAHHVVVTFSSSGMVMYADGAQVASDATVTTEQSYTGWWRAGQADLTGWDSAPTSNYFNGTIDEFAVYPTALSLQKVQVHYCDGANVNCLSMTAPTTVAFPATTLNGLDQTKTITATFDVTDNTGGDGWNVTATSTTFTTGTHLLPAGATTVTSAPSSACDTGFTCTAPTDSVSYPYTLPAGASAPTATKLVNAAVSSGFGHQTVTATFTLTVTGNAYLGSYQSTWTFNLVSGP